MTAERPRYKLGSLFAGIGGFELGLERAIPGLETIWQVEKEPFCQKVLKKNWPNSQIFENVEEAGAHNLEPVDILCGGFPCQDISYCNGKGRGLNGKKSSLWFEMWRIISELRPRIVAMENVPAITFRGLERVLGSLSSLGYSVEWGVISARDLGAAHLRRRWFGIAYPNSSELRIQSNRERWSGGPIFPPVNGSKGFNRWDNGRPQSAICRMDNGVSRGLDKDRLKALGNAIVPQCSELIGRYIANSGLLED